MDGDKGAGMARPLKRPRGRQDITGLVGIKSEVVFSARWVSALNTPAISNNQHQACNTDNAFRFYATIHRLQDSHTLDPRIYITFLAVFDCRIRILNSFFTEIALTNF